MKQILPSAPEIFSLATWLSLQIENGDSYMLQESSGIYRIQGPCLSMMPEYSLLSSHPKGYTLVFGHRT